jgi:hypothetical protein
MTISGSSGLIFPDGSGQETGIGRNRIINGAMQVWQRGTSLTVGSASYTYTADRFKNYSANTSTTVSRNTSVPTGFQYSFQLQRPNGNTGTNSISIVQIIETANCYDLAGQSVTFSFWVKKGANYSGGNISVQILTGTVADQGGDPYSFTGLATAVNDSTYSPTTTWTKVTYTGTVASNVLEMCPVIAFTPTGTAGADDSLYITGVQLEIGSTATPFERRLYGQELANCQRYYQLIDHLSLSAARGTTSIETSFMFPVWMRTAPTIDSSVGQGYQIYDAFGNGFTQSSFNCILAVNGATQKGAFISLANFTGLTQGRTYVTNAANVGKFGISAEL